MRAVMRDDSGIAMLVVIGVMSVVTVLAVGSFALARQSLHESERVESVSQAFRAASSGLEIAVSGFDPDDFPSPNDYEITGGTEDGTYRVTLEELGPNEYRLTSEGLAADGTRERVRQRFFMMNLWKMNLAAGSSDSLISGTSGLNGTSHIIGPFYAKGDLRIRQNMSIFEGPLFVKGGDVLKPGPNNDNFHLGSPTKFIDVYCDGTIPPNYDSVTNKKADVFVGTHSRSVPDIMLPPLDSEDLEEWADKSRLESVKNLMGSTSQPNLESGGGTPETIGDPGTYHTMQPPNTATFSRRKAPDVTGDSSPYYKFYGSSSGDIRGKGKGEVVLRIGPSSFGAWGAISASDGTNVVTIPGSPGPAGVSGYPANAHDDFAYDSVNDILYISGTVFVDGSVEFTEDFHYIGNGTIVANGDITLRGKARPFGNDNVLGEANKWALGLVTPENIYFRASNNNPGGPGQEGLRDIKPAYGGAFYTEKHAVFAQANTHVRGTILAGRMEFESTNNFLVTNPALPTYLPDSLPGGNVNLFMPTLWTRD